MGTTPAPEVVEGEVLPRPPAIGETLNNGGLVLAVKPYKAFAHRGAVLVLALWHGQFVTWACLEGECHWGHYLNTVADGVADFEARQ